jgi:hypothetical protein
MSFSDFKEFKDDELLLASRDTKLGIARGLAIEELARRALGNPRLLDPVCEAISSDRKLGFHARAPIGWLGANCLYISRQEQAVKCLLTWMNTWEANEQEDLVRHWAGKGNLATLSRELHDSYGWSPKYNQLSSPE